MAGRQTCEVSGLTLSLTLCPFQDWPPEVERVWWHGLTSPAEMPFSERVHTQTHMTFPPKSNKAPNCGLNIVRRLYIYIILSKFCATHTDSHTSRFSHWLNITVLLTPPLTNRQNPTLGMCCNLFFKLWNLRWTSLTVMTHFILKKIWAFSDTDLIDFRTGDTLGVFSVTLSLVTLVFSSYF